jgi:hypothetical protein
MLADIHICKCGEKAFGLFKVDGVVVCYKCFVKACKALEYKQIGEQK